MGQKEQEEKKTQIHVATLIVGTYICKVMKIEQAIKQRTFKSEYQKAEINLLYTASWLSQQTTSALRPYNISVQQFNILRILRGMQPEPATVKLLTERMIDKMSNASRLVEKLKRKGLVERRECQQDRRRVNIIITDEGLELLEAASRAVEQNTTARMGNISEQEAEILNDILDRIKE